MSHEEECEVLDVRRTAPDEVLEPARDSEEYEASLHVVDWPDGYRINPRFLAGTKSKPVLTPQVPLIVFINSKSGGLVGPRLTTLLSRTLGQFQVFDVSQDMPGHVLSALWSNFNAAERLGDKEAAAVRQNLRIVVAGGDGTVTWVLGSIIDLGLQPQPPVAVMPLGTGNDFSLNFGWGKAFDWDWVKYDNLYHTLSKYRDARIRTMDAWTYEVFAPPGANGSYFPALPHSLRIDPENESRAFGRFWNYFSVGLDAEAAYDFHHLREHHPHLASGRTLNQAWYGWFSCTTGWFCGAEPLTTRVTMRVRRGPDKEWSRVAIPSNIRAIVLLNLQTYGGGRDIWRLDNTDSLERKGFKEPAYDDGMIEVVGFRSGWHTACVMGQVSKKVHAKRLAQAVEVELQLAVHGENAHRKKSVAYMQLDGEPWQQRIPAVSGAGESLPLRVRVAACDAASRVLCSKEVLGGKLVETLTERAERLANERGSTTTNGV